MAKRWIGVICLAVGMASLAASSPAQQKGQKTFSSPEEASKALLKAAQDNDVNELLQVLGPDAKEIVSSGDADEDARTRQHFVKRYEEMNRLVKEPDGTVSLVIGAQNWPYPIPLRNKNNEWYFDTQAGKSEVLYRRIGYNEMSAIHICDALVEAQKEYYAQEGNAYAQQIFSNEGKKDGLYWKVGEGQPQSPIGPLIAWAVAEEYAKNRGGAPVPYRGYYFHLLTKQGKDGPGGMKDYVVDGKMTQGFAFVAYPAEYRSSGVMTFIVGTDGVVYERDLGKKTETTAETMKEFNPDPHWHKVEDKTPQTAAATGKAEKP